MEGQKPQRDQLVVDEVDADMIEAPPQAPCQPSAASEIIDDEMVSQEEEETEPQPSVPMATEDVTEASQEATKEEPNQSDRSEEAKKEVPEPVPESKPIRTFGGPVTREPSMFIDHLPEAKEEEKVETNSTQDENVQVQDPPVEEEKVDEPGKVEEVVDEAKKEEKESEQPEAPTTEENASTDSKADSEETEAAAKET